MQTAKLYDCCFDRFGEATDGREIIATVPRISAFYGIVIWMYHDEIHHLGRRTSTLGTPMTRPRSISTR